MPMHACRQDGLIKLRAMCRLGERVEHWLQLYHRAQLYSVAQLPVQCFRARLRTAAARRPLSLFSCLSVFIQVVVCVVGLVQVLGGSAAADWKSQFAALVASNTNDTNCLNDADGGVPCYNTFSNNRYCRVRIRFPHSLTIRSNKSARWQQSFKCPCSATRLPRSSMPVQRILQAGIRQQRTIRKSSASSSALRRSFSRKVGVV